MKKVFFAANYGIALLMGTVVTLSSCSEEVTNSENEMAYAPVSVKVNEFSVSMEDFPSTRAAESPATYAGVKAITLAFYDSNGTEAYKETQVKSDGDNSTFGQFSFNIPVGSYTLVAIGYNYFDGDEFTLTSPTAAAFTSSYARETFSATQSVTVTSAAPLSLSITLDRINTWLVISSTDKCPTGAVSVRTTYGAAGKGFSPSTGLATDANGFSVVNGLGQSVGQKVTVGNYAFLSTDEQTMDITLQVLDEDDNVLISRVVSDVPFKRNRKTVLKGPLFTPSSASNVSFTLETDWLTQEVIEY
jgi:hypothetical protein